MSKPLAVGTMSPWVFFIPSSRSGVVDAFRAPHLRSSNLILDLAPDTTDSLPDCTYNSVYSFALSYLAAYQAYVTFGEAIRTLFYNNTIDETEGHVPVGGKLYLVQKSFAGLHA